MKKVYNKPEVVIERIVLDGTIASSAESCGPAQGEPSWMEQARNDYDDYVIVVKFGDLSDPYWSWGSGFGWFEYMESFEKEHGNDSNCYFSYSNILFAS